MIRQIDSSQVSSVLSFSNLGGAIPPRSARLQVVKCIRIQKVKEMANICQILYSIRSKMQTLHGTIFNSLIYFPPSLEAVLISNYSPFTRGSKFHRTTVS